MSRLLILFFFCFVVQAEEKKYILNQEFFGTKYIKGIGFGIGTPSVNTTIKKQKASKSTLKFKSNAPVVFNFSLNTFLGEFSASFDGKEGAKKNLKPTKFRDYYFKTFFSSFELRLNYFDYIGAFIDGEQVETVYDKYRHKGQSYKVSYYGDEDYLAKIQFAEDQKEKLEEADKSYTYLFSLYYDARKIFFPANIAVESQAKLIESNIELPESINSSSIGLLFGLDGTYLHKDFFIRGRASIGLGKKLRNETISIKNNIEFDEVVFPTDIDFSIGTFIKTNHRILFNVDASIVKLRSDTSDVENGAVQGLLSYRYNL